MKRALLVANLAGFATFLLSDMRILKDMGYEVYFAANAKTLPWERTEKILNELEVHFVQVDFDSRNPLHSDNIKAFFQLSGLLHRETFDLVHCHTPIAGIFTRLACIPYRKKGMKVIYTTHGFTFTSHSSWKQWAIYYTVESLMSWLTDAIITINHEDFRNAKKMHCRKTFYINGVGTDVARYRDVVIDPKAYKESLGFPQNKIMILSVGELSERKNHQAVIRALSLLENKQDYCFVVCGNGIEGGTGKKLEKIAQELGVDLLLLGFRKDIPNIMHCSDIGVIPSVREGLGLAGIQSLAAGVPLIGTDVQGIRDYIEEGKTGFLCGVNDYQSIAEKIKILSTSDVRKQMKAACIEKALQFDVSVSERQRKEIYHEILGSLGVKND